MLVVVAVMFLDVVVTVLVNITIALFVFDM
jgi:hypothetical protein